MPFVKIQYEDIFFDPMVQEMCISKNFICPYYNHSWSCPPAAPYLENQIASYEEYYLIYWKFDLQNYIEEEKKKNPKRSERYIKTKYYLKKMDSSGLDKEFAQFMQNYDKPYSKKLFLYSGTCNYCQIKIDKECNYDTGEPCRFPHERRYSMEAVGIEVIKTVLNLNNDIGYPSNKFSYKFGLACFK
jgi:predicted metal-binding protein